MGIAADIWAYIRGLLRDGTGVQEHIITDGGQNPHLVLRNVKEIVPYFTIQNTGAYAVNVGFKGQGSFPLQAGETLVFEWLNPAKANLTVTDLGQATTVDVIG